MFYVALCQCSNGDVLDISLNIKSKLILASHDVPQQEAQAKGENSLFIGQSLK